EPRRTGRSRRGPDPPRERGDRGGRRRPSPGPPAQRARPAVRAAARRRAARRAAGGAACAGARGPHAGRPAGRAEPGHQRRPDGRAVAGDVAGRDAGRHPGPPPADRGRGRDPGGRGAGRAGGREPATGAPPAVGDGALHRPRHHHRLAEGRGGEDHRVDQPGDRADRRRAAVDRAGRPRRPVRRRRVRPQPGAGVHAARRRPRPGQRGHHGAEDLPDPAPERPLRGLRRRIAGRRRHRHRGGRHPPADVAGPGVPLRRRRHRARPLRADPGRAGPGDRRGDAHEHGRAGGSRAAQGARRAPRAGDDPGRAARGHELRRRQGRAVGARRRDDDRCRRRRRPAAVEGGAGVDQPGRADHLEQPARSHGQGAAPAGVPLRRDPADEAEQVPRPAPGGLL
ncbi:MAG: Type II/IV secretion system ATPase TadZ/CpaE, associated with Flp pilus assembly, partial [uncultured Blastococcus sp.]